MVPTFINILMTSAAFTAILCESSATVIVSGTETSRMTGSGETPWVASPSSSPSSWRCFPPLGCFHAVVAAAASPPRSFKARRRAASSWNAVADGLRDLSFFARRSLQRGNDRLRRYRFFGWSGGVGAVALDEGALLADFDLDRARAARTVRSFDLRSLLARQRDLLLLILAAVLFAQVVEQPRLVLLGEAVAFLLAGDARLGELLEQRS